MFINKPFNAFYREEEPGAEGGGGGGAEPQAPSVEELQAQITALTTSNEKLQAHSATLLDEKKKEALKRKESDNLREQQELQTAKDANSLVEFEERSNKMWQGKLDESSAKYDGLYGKLETQGRLAAQGKIMGKFSDEGIAELALEKMIGFKLDDDLNGVIEYKNLKGELITTDRDVFVDYLNTNHADWMVGADSSGALQTQGKTGAPAQDKPLTRAEWDALPPGEKAKQAKNIVQ